MLLTLDIGNSAAKGALFDGDRLEVVFPVPAPAAATDWAGHFQDLFARYPEARIAYASVVPARTAAVEEAAAALGRRPFAVSAVAHLPIRIAYTSPGTLGADRIAAAAAAWMRHGQPRRGPVVAIDAGTAVTYEVVDASGTYHGGAIAPGPSLLLRGLTSGTAQLPDVPLVPPPAAVGRSTTEAIQAGIIFGFIDSVRGMLDRIEHQLNATPAVVATGGWAGLIADRLDRPMTHEPDLVLRGICAIALLNER